MAFFEFLLNVFQAMLSYLRQVINAFLLRLMAKQNSQSDKHIYVLPSYLAVLWNRGLQDHWLYTKVCSEKISIQRFTKLC